MQLQKSDMVSTSEYYLMDTDTWFKALSEFLQHHNAIDESLHIRAKYVKMFDEASGIEIVRNTTGSDEFAFIVVDAAKFVLATLKWNLLYTKQI